MRVPIITAFLLAGMAAAQNVDLRALNSLEWRGIGPAAMGGRISGIEGVAGNPRIIYAATGSGGLFKTINAGTPGRRFSNGPVEFPSATSPLTPRIRITCG